MEKRGVKDIPKNLAHGASVFAKVLGMEIDKAKKALKDYKMSDDVMGAKARKKKNLLKKKGN
jgi:RNase P/RNase MRP subunit p30